MNIAKKRILVTGAAGFIGSHLVEELLARGAAVRALVHYNSSGSCGWLDTLQPAVRKQVEIIASDVRDPHAVRNAVKDIDVVFHLAALIGIPYSYHAPDSYIDTNVKGTLNLLQAAREYSIERFVHTSTSEVYGSAQEIPIDEQHPIQAQSPYSASKAAADHLAQSFFCSFKTPVCTVRPFNTYGPRQSARAVIPTIISQISSGAKQIQLGALFPTRDLSYVSDTVAGFIAAAETDSAVGQLFNLGSGFEISIAQLAQLTAELMGQEIECVEDPQRIRPSGSEVDRLCSNTTKAKSILPWQPQYASLDGLKLGLEQTINWFSKPENQKLYRPGSYSI